VSRTSRGTLVRHNTLSENAAPMVLAEPTPQAFVIAGVLVAVANGGLGTTAINALLIAVSSRDRSMILYQSFRFPIFGLPHFC
jgi:hypothetical protein